MEKEPFKWLTFAAYPSLSHILSYVSQMDLWSALLNVTTQTVWVNLHDVFSVITTNMNDQYRAEVV